MERGEELTVLCSPRSLSAMALPSGLFLISVSPHHIFMNLMHVLPVLLHGRVNNQFLSNTVTGKFPGKLVLPANLLIIVFGIENIVLVGAEFIVIVLDEVGDALHDSR